MNLVWIIANKRLQELNILSISNSPICSVSQILVIGKDPFILNYILIIMLLIKNNFFLYSDLSLLSWLQSIPGDTFSCPFEQRSLNVDVERLKNPTLETSWTEHMLITPIKPNIFPHSAMPITRPKGTDIMTKSLNMSLIASGTK